MLLGPWLAPERIKVLHDRYHFFRKTSKRVKIIETRRNSKERKLKEIRDKLQRICKTKLITNKQFFVFKSFEIFNALTFI